ncbi:hypothetical protein HYDPIDRAFT_120397 [Hydnomerulius pinastri MD-312]|uniref:Uncharacterized protein n=1 Tax=Hydnomerulius pinastri MD-312 TaxID=994086 RepID=A0A0C9VWV9_9AGAM|nr:hypothetical protein HYDPIDRAFT_120397 [Hydnomerulius pinastri MD-312]
MSSTRRTLPDIHQHNSRIYSNTVNSESGAQGTHWTSHVLLNGSSVCGNDVVRSQP